MFNDHAFYWAIGFFVIYLIAQFVVLKHPYFQQFSQIRKSTMVKLLALIGFVVAYGVVTLFI